MATALMGWVKRLESKVAPGDDDARPWGVFLLAEDGGAIEHHRQ